MDVNSAVWVAYEAFNSKDYDIYLTPFVSAFNLYLQLNAYNI